MPNISKWSTGAQYVKMTSEPSAPEIKHLEAK